MLKARFPEAREARSTAAAKAKRKARRAADVPSQQGALFDAPLPLRRVDRSDAAPVADVTSPGTQGAGRPARPGSRAAEKAPATTDRHRDRPRKVSATSASRAKRSPAGANHPPVWGVHTSLAQWRWHPDVQPPAERWLLGSPFLTVALAGSVLLHLIVLSIHFQPEIARMLERAPSLEVTLVNARTRDRPAKADVLAQANLDGGGNTDADRRAKTPLPVAPRESPRTEVVLPPERLEALEREAQELVTQLRSVPVLPPSPKAGEGDVPPDLPSTAVLTQRALEAMRLEAQVARDLEAYQKRPKRRFVGARAEEYRFARYVEDWRLKVERIGNLNYPEAARAQKLYGSLLLSVAIRADGSLDNVEVHRSSGHRVLDAAAIKIVEMGAPYAPLPADIRRDTDVLVITRTWSFTRGEELRTD